MEVSVTNALSQLVAEPATADGCFVRVLSFRRRKVPTSVQCQELRIGLSNVAVVLVSFGHKSRP
jgi:hypothetical protein